MPIDPRKLKPSELCRLLNSTSLGEVISERQLYRHRQRAGHRIGDGQHVDLLRYCAWLHQVRHTPKPQSDVDPYERMKEAARARNAALALAGRDIGSLTAVENPDRKDRASRDFQFFCENYFPLTFHLNWSPDHLKVNSMIEQAVVHGGLFALAMARGSGKLSLAAKANGREFTGPVYIARKSTLGEVIFVTLGADAETEARVGLTAIQYAMNYNLHKWPHTSLSTSAPSCQLNRTWRAPT